MYLKLVSPSIMDTYGLQMLKSVCMVFDLLPIPMNKVVFVKECIDKGDLVNAICQEHKCPVVHTMDLSLGGKEAIQESLHIMVATGVSTNKINIPCIQCKNSYRQNEGKFILNTLFVHIFLNAFTSIFRIVSRYGLGFPEPTILNIWIQ